MVAAHLTKYFPEFELYHIYASSIPTIGVGEGTIPGFPEWLYGITGLKFSSLQERCKVTRKFGIQFENWGGKNKQFMHNFFPVRTALAYHVSAANLAELLQDNISATYLDKKINCVESDGVVVKLKFEDKSQLEVDLAFDASGFPKSVENNEYTRIPLIPTNAALIRRGPVVAFQSATRSIARPHGWIFIIPLTTHTSYGYIYNSSINSRSEIATDLDAFFREEKVVTVGDEKHVNFPNFTCKTFFDGSLCKIGNAASFMEPLEATAMGILLSQIYYVSRYVLKNFSEIRSRTGIFDDFQIKEINNELLKTVWKVALFVGWHYASGSCFDTDFWLFAKSNFEKEIKKLENKDLVCSFEKYLQAGSKFDYWRFASGDSYIKNTFGGFPVASFYEVGHGIGYFS